MDEPTREEALPKSKGRGLGALAVLLIPMAVGGMFLGLNAASTPEVTGSLTLLDGEAPRVVQPDVCASGNLGEDAPRSRPRFFGVDVRNDAARDWSLRVFEEASGEEVAILTTPAHPDGLRLTRDECERLDIRIEGTDQLIYDAWGMRGRVDFECTAVRGSVTFDACY